MPAVTHLDLIDLAVVLLIVVSVLGALRRRSGLVPALAGGASTAVACWVLAAAAVVWAPAGIAAAVTHSQLAQLVPLPVHALTQVGRVLPTGTP